MLRYENVAAETIKVNLHNGFIVIAMAKWDKDNRHYMVTLYIQRKDLDSLRLIETRENIVFQESDRRSIKLDMLKYIENAYDDGFFDIYQAKIDFENKCFDIGLDTLETK